MSYKSLYILLLIGLLPLKFLAQDDLLEIISAKRMYGDPSVPGAHILDGDATFGHNGAIMNCDKAIIYPDSNTCHAFGHIRVNQGDTITITGDSMFYYGNEKVAKLRGNIFLKEKELSLSTTTLNYNMNTGIGNYTTGGKIVSNKNNNTLTSKIGTYNSKTKTLFFKDSVRLKNPEYTVFSDTMVYNTESEISYFHGPTEIISKENKIYCEHGWFDTKSEVSSFWQNAYLETSEQKLQGDSIYYDRNIGLGQVYGNVEMNDTVNDVVVNGDYAAHHEQLDSSIVTGHTLLTQIYEDDTLYMHADTLIILNDSIQQQSFRGYYGVLLFKSDLQASCDSISYSEKDSIMRLYHDPVIWSEENQLTGDLIELKTKDGDIDELLITNNSMIVSEVDSSGYNQIKGKDITGYFTDNKLTKVDVKGNGETIYLLGKENKPVTDFNRSICSDITILLKNNEIDKITFLNTPSAYMKALVNVPIEDQRLQNFRWLIERRPLSLEDLLKE